MHLDLRTLQLFVAVVEERSVAKAARREHIAASAVSKRIADLEKEVELFRRHRTGLSPTPAGHALLHHARMLMRDLAQLESELGDYAQGLRGSIRIFANISAMVQYLPADLSRFLAEHPLVRVDLEEAISPLIVRAVADGVAEIGITAGTSRRPASRCCRTAGTAWSWSCPRAIPYVPSRPSGSARSCPTTWSACRRGSSIDSLVLKAATDLGQPAKLRIRTSGFDAVSRMVHAGLGVATMPQLVAESYRASLKLATIPLDEPWASRTLDLGVRNVASLPAATGRWPSRRCSRRRSTST